MSESRPKEPWYMLPCVRFFRKKLSESKETKKPASVTDVNLNPGSPPVDSTAAALDSEKLSSIGEKASAPIVTDTTSQLLVPVSATLEASQSQEATTQTEPCQESVFPASTAVPAPAAVLAPIATPAPTASASKPDPKPYAIDRDIIMVVMGATGVGKTTFINALTATFPRQDVAHHDLDSGTKDVQAITIDLPDGIKLVLVDTPGFDDSSRSNADILACISKYLADRYRNGKLLDGLIYLHRITDIRFDAGAATALNIFRKLYGSEGYDKLGLVTTMWNDIKPDLKYKYEEKEKELRETSWGTFLKREDAAVLARFDSSVDDEGRADSLKVIEELAKRSLQNQLKLKLQRELVDEKIRLPMTDAGKAAFSLAEMAKYYLKEITS